MRLCWFQVACPWSAHQVMGLERTDRRRTRTAAPALVCLHQLLGAARPPVTAPIERARCSGFVGPVLEPAPRCRNGRTSRCDSEQRPTPSPPRRPFSPLPSRATPYRCLESITGRACTSAGCARAARSAMPNAMLQPWREVRFDGPPRGCVGGLTGRERGVRRSHR